MCSWNQVESVFLQPFQPHLVEVQLLSSRVDRLKLDGHLPSKAQVDRPPEQISLFISSNSPSLVQTPVLLAKDIAELGEGRLGGDVAAGDHLLDWLDSRSFVFLIWL